MSTSISIWCNGEKASFFDNAGLADPITVPFRHPDKSQGHWIELVRRLGNLAEKYRSQIKLSEVQRDTILGHLLQIGSELANLLFPNQGWSVVGPYLQSFPGADIEVHNYVWIPWEIFYYGPELDAPAYQGFCGYQRTIYRVSRQKQKVSVPNRKPKLGFLPFSGWSKGSIMSSAKDIEEVGFESLEDKIIRKEFSALNPEKRRQREIIRLRTYLMEADLVHFSALITPVLQHSFLLLDNGFWLSIDDFIKIIPNEPFLFYNSPLVFFNVRDNYTRHPLHILRYVQLFHDLEALGVITSTLPIPNYLAAQFSQLFYKNLLQDGQLIGEALTKTRQYFIEQLNNPFALFYVPYLAPSAKMRDSPLIGPQPFAELPLSQPPTPSRTETLATVRNQPPFLRAKKECTFSISCQLGSNIKIRASGAVNLITETAQPLVLDRNAYARQAEQTDHPNWRSHVKQQGKQLYKQVFEEQRRVLRNYEHALGTAGAEHLHLRFESTPDLLTVPLEFLFDVDDGGHYLVLKHPFARRISGIRTINDSLSPDFFNGLHVNGEPFKVLLISSSTPPHLPSIDQEIQEIHALLHHSFAKLGIAVQITRMSSERATYQRVRRELKQCQYHMIHYAGHGIYDHLSPEKSALFFWEKNNWSGKVIRMSVSELNTLLTGSNTRFVYLSCCSATKTGDEKALLADDFLGIADGLIHAKIPAVLGYRWPVFDRAAKKMALAFYRFLAEQGHIDTALLHARRELAAKNRDDITWLSPILIMQG